MEIIRKITEVVREAGKIILEAQRDPSMVDVKAGKANFVTTYDKRVQAFLYEHLHQVLPQAQLVGEEDETKSTLGNGFAFIIDPIDGTINFIKDYHGSVISVGLLLDGQGYGGVVYNPYLDEMYYAKKGEGAYLNGKRIFVSKCPMKDGLLLFGSSPYYPELHKKSFHIAYELFNRMADIRRSGSAAIDLCAVACGRADVYFELFLSPWDYAAGSVILQEAGGKITQMDGSPIIYDKGCSVLVTNGRIEIDKALLCG